jgi:phosphoglycolate phosphatase-like HAD superfamily hydrolase
MTSESIPAVVIFDIDGTLLNSNDAHARAWVEAMGEFHYVVDLDETRRLIGKGGDKLLRELTGVPFHTDIGRSIDERRRRIFCESYLAKLEPQNGARALVARVLAEHQRPVVATSAQGEELALLLQRAGIADLIEAAASSADAERSKPDPDVVCAALQRAGVAANRAIMVGDTPYDRDAAHRASVPFVGLRCGGWDDEAFSGAAAIYDDPAALLREYSSSPLGGGRSDNLSTRVA